MNREPMPLRISLPILIIIACDRKLVQEDQTALVHNKIRLVFLINPLPDFDSLTFKRQTRNMVSSSVYF